MKVGIVGYAGSGKSTIFGALTGTDAGVPGGSRETRLGTIRVPDDRVDTLAGIFSPKKTTCAEVVFADLPGVARTQSGGLDTGTVEQLKKLDALALVVRDFEGFGDAADPARDAEDFGVELVLSDQILVDRRIERMRKEGKKGEREFALFEQMLSHLEDGKPLRTLGLETADLNVLSGYQFASLTPLLIVVNTAEDADGDAAVAKVAGVAEEAGAVALALSGQLELEIADLDPEERGAFLADLGLESPASDRFIQKAYELLDLISFLTAGPDECRAWTITRGTNAQRAAGKIHSDLERGFIRAEVYRVADLQEHGSEAALKPAGKLRVEGKNYTVQDGDVMNIRFNV